jgi:hypothetical protein
MMNRLGVPWLVGLVTLASLFFTRGPAKEPAMSAPAAPAKPSTASGQARAEGEVGTQGEEGWAPYIRLYEDFFGVHQAAIESGKQILGSWGEQRVRLQVLPGTSRKEDPDRDREKLEIIAHAAAPRPAQGYPGYDLEFMVALVPDPRDSRLASNFDLVVAGIQMGLGQSKYHYLFDRQWLPSASIRPLTEETASRGPAAITLFRGELPHSSGPRRLMTVFLVGETPIAGIDKQAFQQAVGFISSLTQAVDGQHRDLSSTSLGTGDRRKRDRKHRGSGGASSGSPGTGDEAAPRCPLIRVLGPASSGSAESLGIAMRSLPSCEFSVVSGSATVPNIERFFPSVPSVRFTRTVVPDDVLADTAFHFLHDKLGWDLRYAALLIEEGTAYASFFNRTGGEMSQMAKIYLPRGLQSIRNDWEESRAEGWIDKPAGGGNISALGTPRAGPRVTLVDQVTPLDRPEVSPLTAHIEDVALDNLLRRISRYGYRYIGIVGTDVKDMIFLAERLRQLAPDVIVFVLQGNLLYASPRSPTSAMFGALAISSFPLIPRGSRPPQSASQSAPPGNLSVPPTRQFSSEAQAGIFQATLRLLCEPSEPAVVWIAATGNTSMSPLARIPVAEGAGGDSRCPIIQSLPGRVPAGGNLPLLFFLIFLCVLGTLVVRPPYLPHWRAKPSFLTALAAAVAYAMAVGILILVLLPTMEPNSFAANVHPGTLERIVHVASYFAILWMLLILATATGLFSKREQVRWPRRVLAALVVLVCLAPLWNQIEKWMILRWSLGAPGLFYLRAYDYGNGLSPFLPLEWLAGALFAWLFIELKRQNLRERQRVSWLGPTDREAALNGSEGRLIEIERLLGSGLPWGWICFVVVMVLLSLVVPFWKATQPIAESAGFGRFVLALLVFIFVLSVTSFYRFARSWHLLRHVLGRLEHCGCRRSFEKLSKIVHWNPMKSFVWYSPSFRGLAHPIELLEKFEKRTDSLWLQPLVSRLRGELKEALGCEGSKRVGDEGRAREKVEDTLVMIRNELAQHELLRRAEDLDALLIVNYLRKIFAQLRYALMGAMVPTLLLLGGLSSYTFVPRHYLWVLFWCAIMLASILSLVIFVQMDRDFVLSRISGTPPGKVTLDRAFVSNIFTYAILPLAAVISSQVPQIGQLVGRWLEPLTRVLETS